MSQLHQVALTYIKSVGPTLAKMLVSHFGDAESVFKTSPGKMLRVPGIGEKIVSQLNFREALEKAEEELNFIPEFDTCKRKKRDSSVYDGFLIDFQKFVLRKPVLTLR